MTVHRNVPRSVTEGSGIPLPVLNHVFAHDNDLVIVTTGGAAYRTGISFSLLILSKPPMDFVTEFAFGIAQRRHAGSLDLAASATLRDGSEQSIDLGAFHDGATAHRADSQFWVPLPDEVKTAQVRLTWPTMQVDDTASIDIHIFRLMIFGREHSS